MYLRVCACYVVYFILIHTLIFLFSFLNALILEIAFLGEMPEGNLMIGQKNNLKEAGAAIRSHSQAFQLEIRRGVPMKKSAH